jgi:hypothetical protein
MTRSNKTLVAAVVVGLIAVSAGSATAGNKNGGLKLNFGKPQGMKLFSGQNFQKQNHNNNQQFFKKQVVHKQNFKKQDCHPHQPCYPKKHCSKLWGFNYCYTPTPVVYCDPYKKHCDPHLGPGSLSQLQALIAARMAQSADVVVGTWRSAPAEGIELAITLNANRTFAWVVTADGKSTVLSGTYSVAGNAVTLISGTDGDVVRGTIVANEAGAISLAFPNPTDATMAITFAR